jgi:Divergent InlB B-repeat domain/FG-GAP repeat
MIDRIISLYFPTVADARSVVCRILQLCLPVLLLAAPLCSTQPATAQTNGPKLTASDPIGLAKQGFSVAVSANGNTAIVGGPFDNNGAGAAWIFTRSGGTWMEQQKLTASDASGAAQLGWSVSISDNGNTAIVGGPGDNNSSGAAWVFTQSGGVWTQQGAKLSGIGAVGSAEQGYAVAISGDASTAIIGGWADSNALGAAWVFTQSSGTWSQQGSKLSVYDASANTDILLGFSVALSDNGSSAIVGGPNDSDGVGAAWVFAPNPDGQWVQQVGKLVGADGTESQQGFSVAMASGGGTAIVGGPGQETSGTDTIDGQSVTVIMSNGAAWVWVLNGNEAWVQQGGQLSGTPTNNNSNPGQGFSVALGGGGSTLLVGGPADNANTGAAWVFTRSNGTWTQQGNALVGTGAVGAAGQATSVALSKDGTTPFIGGSLDQNQNGAAWVFVSNGGQAAVTISVTGSGSVTSGPSGITCPSTCTADFGGGTSVSLTATPASGWSFSGWSGGACGGGGSCTMTINSVESVTATFVPLFTLTVSGSGSGTITSNPSSIDCQTMCSASYGGGTQVTLTAAPVTGYVFTGWSGACSGTGSCIVNMSAAEDVTATFAQGLTRTFVSSTGVDSNPCTVTEPCATFAHAYTLTGADGIIAALDPGKYGALTITGPITVDGNGWAAITDPNGGSAITITAGASDAIVLRGVTIDGAGGGGAGIYFSTGRSLTLTGSIVRNVNGNGLAMINSNGTLMTLAVKNSSFINTNTNGAYLATFASGAVTASFVRTEFSGNGANGLQLDGTLGTGAVSVTVTDSVAANNFNSGFEVDSNTGQSVSNLTLTAVQSAGNGAGMTATGANATLWLGQSIVAGNSTAYSVQSNDVVINSFGDNSFARNGSGTGALTPVSKQ